MILQEGNTPLDLIPRSNTQRYEFAVKQLVEGNAFDFVLQF